MLAIHLFILIMSFPLVYMQSDTCNCDCDCNCNKNEYFYEDCGHVVGTTTISKGEEANPGQFPWQVLVGDDVSGELCGGSLITHQHVLTAAHCVFGRTVDEITVLVGHIYWDKALPDDFSHISAIKIYPSFTTEKAWVSKPDISILTLEHSVKFSERKFQKHVLNSI